MFMPANLIPVAASQAFTIRELEGLKIYMIISVNLLCRRTL